MNTPRDRYEHDRKGLVSLARLLSNIISPPVIFALLGLALSLKSLPFWQNLAWAAVNGFVISLLPIIFVLWLLKTGRIAELHMSDTGERHLPYLSAVLCGLIMLFIIRVFDGPELLRCLVLFNIITIAALGIINSRWLISFHATAISAAWMIISFVFGWTAGLWVLPFLLLVVTLRLFLKRHTPAQTIAGLALGSFMVWILTLYGCFV